jgi:GAF domain-containing protein
MRELLLGLFPLTHYPDSTSQRRAVGTYLGAVLILVGMLALLGASLLVSGSVNGGLPLASGFIVVALVTIVMTRIGQQKQAALLLLGLVLFNIVALCVTASFDGSLGIVAAMFGISLGILIIGQQIMFLFVGISIASIILGAAVNPFNNEMAGWIAARDVAILLGYAAVNYVLSKALSRETTASTNAAAPSKANEASLLVTQRLLATRLDLNNLLKETVKLIPEIFSSVSDVQIYLVDKDQRNATLAATTRPNAEMPVGQQIGIGSLSVIGRVTISGQSIVVQDTSEDRPYRRTAFLEGTRAELAIPLRVGNDTIGALDLQSPASGAFDPEEVKVLETVANQIAVAVDNARLYSDSQSQLAENKKLFEQARTNLREIERLNQQLTGGAWGEYLRAQAAPPAYTVDLVSGQVEDAAEWTPTLADAAQRNQINVRQTDSGKMIALPISVRGQAIGAMEFELSAEQDVTPEQITILQQVLERLGLAAENARLFEEAQRIAQREALVNEISARMQVTTNVEAVIAAATQSLADAFQAPRVAIRLGTPADGQQTNQQSR